MVFDFEVDQQLVVILLSVVTALALAVTRCWRNVFLSFFISTLVVCLYAILRTPDDADDMESPYGELLSVEKRKRAKVGPLPGVTQDIAGFKVKFSKSCEKINLLDIAQRPIVYVLDTPGVVVPTIPHIETGLKLALTGVAREVQSVLYSTLSEFKGDLEDENQLEILIEEQFLNLDDVTVENLEKVFGLVSDIDTLNGFESVKAVHLDPVPFDMERDHLNLTFKKKRPQLLKYCCIIDNMYKNINK
ncbi:hypothetical protein L2E82_06653 [Cichorium intybus]|uniref:Uncharacterized protein n=1 Tax=Cichorium intybus TaxID=13427 RepID=A0ACB9HBD9_CICIN|nr:hypothetical protein L2E82_06653 [Cichorium intybus]